MIWRNFFRELVHTTSRLVSVIIITALAVMMNVGLSGIYSNGHRIVDSYFSESNIASYWITGAALDSRDIRELADISGVLEIQPRVVLDAESRYDENLTLELYAVAGGYGINTPLIHAGRFPENPREMMLSDAFAKANGLKIGDTFEMKLATGDIIKKEICALIQAPECLNHYNATHMTPDLGAFGFAYMDADAISDVIGKNVYNQVCIITGNVDDAAFKRAVDAALGNKARNVLALEDNSKVYSLIEQIDSIELILRLFPLIFFLVAVLIMFSTMSRLVENARMSIGTFKALGYPDAKILLYYMYSSVIVVLLGFALGALPATKVLTELIFNALAHSMDMPPHAVAPDTMSLLSSLGLTCFFCMGTALIVTLRALQERPSECMRPRPPKKERAIVLERVTPLWRLFSFSQKYIIRNMMRNKTRMTICIVGITGCMTLCLCAFSLDDSINHEVGLLSSNLYRYDYMISFESDVGRAQYEHVAKLPEVSQAQFDMTTSAKIYSKDMLETAVITVEEDVLWLKLLDRASEWPFVMPRDGVILEEELANRLGVGVGETALLKFPDKSEYYKVNITAVRPAVDGIIIGKSYWRALGRTYMPTSAYVKTTAAPSLLRKLDDYDFVQRYKSKSEMTDAIQNEISSLSLIVFILILFGGVLALVVLYNLGIMSFFEQIRSLATLMVLGFYDRETRKLLLSENIVFASIGILCGTPLGIKLTDVILTSLATFHFNLWVAPVSYAAAAAITLGFAVIVNVLLGLMMRGIDMLGALKSVE